MRPAEVSVRRCLLIAATVLAVSAGARAQAPSAPSRIVDRVDENILVTLRGNTHPWAQPQYDRGAAPPSLAMGRMLLVLKRSDAQEAVLEKLLGDQQDQTSPSYHQWLTPDEFGRQFGPSDEDVQKVALWLVMNGFQIGGISRGRTVIEFSGTAQQVQQAFHTEIHSYLVNGEQHWANAGDPQIPAALAPVVSGVNSLHNFAKKPMYRLAAKSSLSGTTADWLGPETTLFNGNACPNNGCYFVSPYDFATIYNVLPLWNATPAIDGTGQSIAIVNRTDINIQDVRDFRNLFGLPANDPQIVLNGPDPGTTPDETEADLDVEWSGAVAKGATINLVIAASTTATDGVDLAALYAVENNVAPVISESFGQCELFVGNAGNVFQSTIRQQASAEGITFITSSGDQGAAVCDDVDSGEPPLPAIYGLSVSGLASTPYGVAVGGTDFLNFGSTYDFNVPSPYWNATNDPQHQASARGYVPETTWNDSCTNNVWVVFGIGSTPEASCNNAQLAQDVLVAGGSGGKSNCVTSSGATPSSCSGGYPKPSWQSAPGVPADGARDVPDVSLFASDLFMGSSYIVCEADQQAGPCSLAAPLSTFVGVGGTSASAPAFAGIMALVNQATGAAGQGNANYILYKIASSSAQTSQSCGATSTSPSAGCIFYDVTSGTIEMPCAKGSPNCNVSNGADVYGVLGGYSATSGYDLATGLGSVNAANLIHNWIGPANSSSTTLSLNGGKAVNITHGQSVSFSVDVTPSAASGVVSLMGSPNGTAYEPLASFSLQNGSASGSTSALAGGTSYSVKAHYPGNGTYGPSDSAPITVTVAPEPSKTVITIPVFNSSTGALTANTPTSISYGSVIGVRVDVGNAQAKASFPPQPVCALFQCATGNVTVTDAVNGGPASPLPGAGGFTLNPEGYAENDGIQLSGGSHQIAGVYSGDNSYSAGSGSYALTVTPAATVINPPGAPSTVIAGQQTPLSSLVTTNVTLGAAPSGTITFYDGATPLSGAVTLYGQPGFGQVTASLSGSSFASFATSGVHTITAKYSGDSNYQPATSAASAISVVYPTTASETASATTVNLGTSITLTATISSSFKNPPMTGTFQFYGNTAIASGVTGTLGTDANGNQVLTASVTTTPQGNEGIQVTYSGDSNFQGASAFVFVNVILPNFNIATSSPNLTINAGQSGSAQVTLTPVNNLSSSVTLACSVSNLAGASCGFNPASPLSLSNGAAASSTLTVSTLPPSSSTSTSNVALRLGGIRLPPPGPWNACLVLGVGIVLIALCGQQNSRLARRLGSVGLVCVMLGCSTGSSTTSSGTGGNGGGNGSPAATSLTLTTAAIKVPSGSNVALTVTVAGTSAKAAGGTVTFFDSGSPLQTVVVANGSATYLTPFLFVGTHVITAQYSGDANNQAAKTNGALNQVITGTTVISVSGSSPGIFNSMLINVTIQ